MIAKRLRSIRNQKSIKQYEVAIYLGITRPACTAYESGKRQPDLATVAKLAEFFDTTTDYLLGKSDNPHPLDPEIQDAPIAFMGNTDGLNVNELEKIINRAVKQALDEREKEKGKE